MSDPDATRDWEPKVGGMSRQPKQTFDNGMSGWKPPSGGGGDAHGGSGFSSTDVPDFLPEEGSEAAARAAGISYTDGMHGSQMDPNRKQSSGPELAGALDSDPDIYLPDAEVITKDASMFVLPEESFKITKMAMSQTDEDYETFVDSTGVKDFVIDVKPVCMTFENFVCGFTADSHPAFTCSPDTGKMERRNGPPTAITVHINPAGASGDLVGYLCFILPDEQDFSSFYKITCASR